MLRESGEFSLPPFLYITYMSINRYYPGEPVNIHMQSLINIIQGKKLGNYHQKRVRVYYQYFVVMMNG